jgi:hypothetical protein
MESGGVLAPGQVDAGEVGAAHEMGEVVKGVVDQGEPVAGAGGQD